MPLSAREPRTIALGGGVQVPYPEPTSAAASAIGRANRRRDTKVEVEVRSRLQRLGLRFRKDLLIRAGSVRTHADIVFTRARLAVFLDGCFWHCCPEHFSPPKSNLDYWKPKLQRNVERDAVATAALREHGWVVLRVWEHENPEDVAQRIVVLLVGLGHGPARRAQGALSIGMSHPSR